MASTVSPAYFLSKHAHICVAGDTLFVLDEVDGNYLSIPKDSAASISPFVLDWPLKSNTDEIPRILYTMIERGLITDDFKQGKSATPAKNRMPAVWLRDEQPRGCPKIKLIDLYRFVISAGYSLIYKRFIQFKKIISTVEKRKKLVQTQQNIDIEKLGALVRVFDWLRPFAFKKTDECFLYCWALSRFLSQYGIYPNWVFAVQDQPFSAHCWLQYGDRVLTDIPFNLRRMAPILVL